MLGCEDKDLIQFSTFQLVDLLEVVEANIAAKSEHCRCGLCGGVLSVMDDLQGGQTCFAPASASVWPSTSQCCWSPEISAPKSWTMAWPGSNLKHFHWACVQACGCSCCCCCSLNRRQDQGRRGAAVSAAAAKEIKHGSCQTDSKRKNKERC